MKKITIRKFLPPSILHILNICIIFVLFSASFFWQQKTYAAASISFSKYRFVFDDQLRQDSLVLTNSGSNAAICTLSSENFLMSEAGPLKLATKEDNISNSAEKILRFSPRKVTINAANKQTVRIASRRRPNINDGEYLSYLKMSCVEQTNPNEVQTNQIAIKANFVHYIPVQVRVGKLSATTRIDNPRLTSIDGTYSLSFDHIRGGSRSIIGKINIVDKETGDILGKINNTAIYMPFTKKEHRIALSTRPDGPVEIIFTEEKTSLGDLITKTLVPL